MAQSGAKAHEIEKCGEGDKMFGTYKHTIDAKGRLCIPASLREDLGETFYVTLWMEQCLVAHTKESWDKLMEKYNAMTAREQKRMRPILAHAAKCEVDGQGRIILPQELREHVGLKKNVAVVGMGGRAEIWDAEQRAEIDADETKLENLEEIFMELEV